MQCARPQGITVSRLDVCHAVVVQLPVAVGLATDRPPVVGPGAWPRAPTGRWRTITSSSSRTTMRGDACRTLPKRMKRKSATSPDSMEGESRFAVALCRDNGAVQAPPRPRSRSGPARAARRREAAGAVRDRARPRSLGSRLPVRRPARDHLRRGRAGRRAPGRGGADRRRDRARRRLGGRGRGPGRRAARSRPSDLVRDRAGRDLQAPRARAVCGSGHRAAGLRGVRNHRAGGRRGRAGRLPVRAQADRSPGPARAHLRGGRRTRSTRRSKTPSSSPGAASCWSRSSSTGPR